MEKKEKTNVLILEADQHIVESIAKILKRRSYAVTSTSEKGEALTYLGEKLYPMAVVGDAQGSHSPFDSMRDIVMASPMTSMSATSST